MKFVEPRPYADPDIAARKLVVIASTIEPVQNDRIYIELVNAPFLKAGGSPDEFRAGLDRQGLVGPARERHLRAVHRVRRSAVRLTADPRWCGDGGGAVQMR